MCVVVLIRFWNRLILQLLCMCCSIVVRCLRFMLVLIDCFGRCVMLFCVLWLNCMNMRFQILMQWLLFFLGDFGGLFYMFGLWLQKILVYGLYGLVLFIVQKLFDVQCVFLLLLIWMICLVGMLIFFVQMLYVLLFFWQMVIYSFFFGSWQIVVSSFYVNLIVLCLKQLLNEKLLSILKNVWWCVVQLMFLRLLCLLFVCMLCCVVVVCEYGCGFVLRKMFLNWIMFEFVNISVGLLLGMRFDEWMIVWFFDLKNLRNFLWILVVFMVCGDSLVKMVLNVGVLGGVCGGMDLEMIDYMIQIVCLSGGGLLCWMIGLGYLCG